MMTNFAPDIDTDEAVFTWKESSQERLMGVDCICAQCASVEQLRSQLDSSR